MDNQLIDASPPVPSRALPAPYSWRNALLSRWFRRLAVGSLSVRSPDGRLAEYRGAQPGPAATLIIRDLNVVNRMLAAGDVGFAEAYMAGEWETTDLRALLTLGALNGDALASALDKSLAGRVLARVRHALRTNSRRGSRRNIAAHYDLGNAFYAQWLDESMTYSSALFADAAEPMPEAQRRKYLRLADQLDLQPGETVLEIGCGWGGFAEIAASDYGCHVVALTLSREQAAFARERMRRAGLEDRVEIRLQDYRDVTETFDKVASIEMFEAVGEAYWATYLTALRDRLKPGGRAALQIITMDDAAFPAYRANPDFIQRYIFPGGMLPSPSAFAAAVDDAGLTIVDTLFFGLSYAETLRRWDRDFVDAWPAIRDQGFDERFRRMWRYYLCYCEVGFDIGRIDVGHFTIVRE